MNKAKSFLKQYFVLVILLFLIVLFGILSPDSFLTMSNMFTIVRQSAIMGIATIGVRGKVILQPHGKEFFT